MAFGVAFYYGVEGLGFLSFETARNRRLVFLFSHPHFARAFLDGDSLVVFFFVSFFCMTFSRYLFLTVFFWVWLCPSLFRELGWIGSDRYLGIEPIYLSVCIGKGDFWSITSSRHHVTADHGPGSGLGFRGPLSFGRGLVFISLDHRAGLGEVPEATLSPDLGFLALLLFFIFLLFPLSLSLTGPGGWVR